MSEIPKTQEEWLEHFKGLARKHGDILAQPLINYFANKILLTKEEIREAREVQVRCKFFLDYDIHCEKIKGGRAIENDPYCLLCKKLTQFAKGGGDE